MFLKGQPEKLAFQGTFGAPPASPPHPYFLIAQNPPRFWAILFRKYMRYRNHLQGVFFNCPPPKMPKYKKKLEYPDCPSPKISKCQIT